jgi:catechol 2,3-dioxygenase-like lactoylglutathione lyase family enzyme
VPDRGLNHLCIVVEPFELDALLQKLREERIPIREEAARRRDDRGASISTYVEDPDGHGVEIKQYPN